MKTKWLQAAVLAVLMTGCGGNAPVSVSVRTGAPRAAQGVASQQLQVATGITLNRARLLVRKLELETAEAAAATSQQTENEDAKVEGREELEAGPLVIDLADAALEGGVQKVIDVAVPAGTYKKIEFKIAKASNSDPNAATDANVKEMAQKESSIILNGTVDGQPFEFVSALDVKQEFEGNFTLGNGSNNLTLNVDPTSWFTDANGARLDPSNSSSRSIIEGNIKRSMKVLKDDDKDGRDDEHEDDHGTQHD